MGEVGGLIFSIREDEDMAIVSWEMGETIGREERAKRCMGYVSGRENTGEVIVCTRLGIR
jgi:hypothetical protein